MGTKDDITTAVCSAGSPEAGGGGENGAVAVTGTAGTTEMSVSQYAGATGYTRQAILLQITGGKLKNNATVRKIGAMYVISVPEGVALQGKKKKKKKEGEG